MSEQIAIVLHASHNPDGVRHDGLCTFQYWLRSQTGEENRREIRRCVVPEKERRKEDSGKIYQVPAF